MRAETSISIAAPPERVWPIMSDVGRWPQWTASVTSVQRLEAGEFRVGSRAKVKQPKFPSAVWQVTTIEPGRHFEWQNVSPGLRSVGGHRVEPDGDGSRVTLWVEQTGLLSPVMALFAKGITQRYLRMEAEGLKTRSESSD